MMVRLRASFWWTLPVITYVLLSLLGVTTSSLGVDSLRQDAANPRGTTIGAPEPIRSDEYMTETTIALGKIAAGPEGTTNPLSVDHSFFTQFPAGPVGSLVFFEGSASLLGPWLPDAMLFAAKWWLPTVLLLLGVPAWFRLVTGSRRWGYLACALIFFSPSNAWWSGRPVNTLGFMFAAAALMLAAQVRVENGKRWAALAMAFVSAVLMARFPTYYQPFAIVLGFPVLMATVVVLLVRADDRRKALTTVLVTGILAAVLTGLVLLESVDSIKAGFDTVYPGHRRSTAMAMTFGFLFGAAALGGLEHAQDGLVSTNASEVTSSFTVLLLATALVAPRVWRGCTSAERAVLASVFAFAGLWFGWCTVNLGAIGEHLPLLNLVPPVRATQAVGYIAIFAFCLVMALWRGSGDRSAGLAAGMVVAMVTWYAGWSYNNSTIPFLSDVGIFLGGLLAGLCVGALIAVPRSVWPIAGTICAAALLTGLVNPIQIGLGDLRGTATANYFMEAGREARNDRTLWASDTPSIDALMFATGTPALSSRQQLGPVREQWERLDPGQKHINAWNRGGTYIEFVWNESAAIAWANPVTDHVVMTTSPCTVARRVPELGHIVSTKALDQPCLTFERMIVFTGREQYVYAVKHPQRTKTQRR